MDFEQNEKELLKYIEECRKKVEDWVFEYKLQSESIRMDLIKSGKVSQNISLEESIKFHKNEMIDIKLNHTMRVVKAVSSIAQKLNISIDFEKVLKVSALLHDIARFDQAVFSYNFNDKDCKQFNGMYHSEYGFNILYVNNKFKDFSIPNNYKFAISQVVKYHQVANLEGDFKRKFQNVNELNVHLLTGNENLNECEKIVVSALVQIVKDVDMLDILYQHLTNEFPVISSSITYTVNGETIDELSKKYDIDKKEIMEYNNMQDENISNFKFINIPVKNINPNLLSVPLDIQKGFFNNENLDLIELQSRKDWNFIVGMWWRLNHFLNSINFVSNLEVVKENELLDNIYKMYPDKYKLLVIDAFNYAKEYLLEKVLKENKNEYYIDVHFKTLK